MEEGKLKEPILSVERDHSSGPNKQSDKVVIKIKNCKGSKSTNTLEINQKDKKGVE